jgi:hypothetical protein
VNRLAEFHRLRAIDTDECVEWPYGLNKGHGRVRIGKRREYVHRLALTLASGGVAPEGMFATHGPCHNPACMNVRHLRWGTAVDNMADKKRDGTHYVGEAHPVAKLSDADAAAIRASKERQVDLGEKYGIDPSYVSMVRRGIARKEQASS